MTILLFDDLLFEDLRTYGLANLAEVVYQRLILQLLMDIETVPEVAADDDASEAQVTYGLDGVEIHAAQRIDVAVDESTARSLL